MKADEGHTCGLTVPSKPRQRRGIMAVLVVAAALLLLLTVVRSTGRGGSSNNNSNSSNSSNSGGGGGSTPTRKRGVSELVHHAALSVTGPRWWLTRLGEHLLGAVHKGMEESPASREQVSLPPLAQLWLPWARDVGVSVQPLRLNGTVADYAEGYGAALVWPHLGLALLLGLPLSCTVGALGAWPRRWSGGRWHPLRSPRPQQYSRAQRAVPKRVLRGLCVWLVLLALVLLWTNGAVSSAAMQAVDARAAALTGLDAAAAATAAAAAALPASADALTLRCYGQSLERTQSVVSALPSMHGGMWGGGVRGGGGGGGFSLVARLASTNRAREAVMSGVVVTLPILGYGAALASTHERWRSLGVLAGASLGMGSLMVVLALLAMLLALLISDLCTMSHGHDPVSSL
eukprot:COSAG01_NODE_337_length_18678_cov_21.905969_10_plen_403_part_00